MPPVVDLPAFLQQALKCFQNREVVGSLGEDSLQGHAANDLGKFLDAFSLTITKVQGLQTEVQKLKEAAGQDALQIKNLSQRETALYIEVSSLRQTDEETKKLLFEKSEETLHAHAKILDLRKEVIDLHEKAKQSLAKMARLEEKVTQQEVQLGQLEGELARKDKLFNQTKEELTNDVVDAFGAGFEDTMAQVACVHPGWISLKSTLKRESLLTTPLASIFTLSSTLLSTCFTFFQSLMP